MVCAAHERSQFFLGDDISELELFKGCHYVIDNGLFDPCANAILIDLKGRTNPSDAFAYLAFR